MNGSITGLYGGLTALLVIGLGVRVVRLRMRHRVGLGDGGIAELSRAIRAHGNLVENAPLALLLMLIAELSAAAPPVALHAAGVAVLTGRLLHAFGLSRSPTRSPGRFLGVLLTWLTILALALLLIVRGLAR
ncbi:MAG TPA: MAPEG family protein [Steroidobacteraceae bacterium]|nr:MAPEG family protein [Steroidobacteraceae bacterium]